MEYNYADFVIHATRARLGRVDNMVGFSHINRYSFISPLRNFSTRFASINSDSSDAFPSVKGSNNRKRPYRRAVNPDFSRGRSHNHNGHSRHNYNLKHILDYETHLSTVPRTVTSNRTKLEPYWLHHSSALFAPCEPGQRRSEHRLLQQLLRKSGPASLHLTAYIHVLHLTHQEKSCLSYSYPRLASPLNSLSTSTNALLLALSFPPLLPISSSNLA